MKGFHDFLVYWLGKGYAYIFDKLASISQNIFDTGWFSDPFILSMTENIQNAISGIAYTLMIIFFFVELIDLVSQENLTDLPEEFIYRLFIKLSITRILIHYTTPLLTWIVDTTNYFMLEIPSITTTDAILEKLLQSIDSTIPLRGSNLFTNILVIIQQLLFGAGLALPLAIFALVVGAVAVLSYVRNIELLILLTIAPIPFCFIPYGKTRDIPKKFILSFASVALQGMIMLIAIGIIMAILATTTSIWEWIILFVVLAVAVAKAGSWAKECLGLG